MESLAARILLAANTGTALSVSGRDADLLRRLISWVQEYGELDCDRTDGQRCADADDFRCSGCMATDLIATVGKVQP